MKLTISHSADTQAIASSLLDGLVAQPLFGELDVRRLQLAPTDAGLAVMQVKKDLARWNSPTGQKMLVVFQFHERDAAQHESALARYVDDREPALARHGGAVVLSAVTERGEHWPFDGFEIIDFPSPETVGQLMQDDDYRQRTATSSSVFGGAFAMAPIKAA